MAEQFAFEQVLRDGRAIDGDEGRGGAGAALVQALGQQFLARSARSQQHDRRAGGCHALDHAGDFQHLGRCRDQAAEDGAIRADPCGETAVLRLDAMQLEGATHDQSKLVDVDRLGVEIIRPALDRVQGTFACIVAAGDDDLGVGLQRHDRVEHRETLAGPVGIRRKA